MVKREGQGAQGGLARLALQLTFPHCDAMPAHLGEFLLHLFVTLLVSCNLPNPKVGVGLGHPELLAFMPMPKTTIYKNAGSILSKYQIRTSWQTRAVQSIPVPSREQEPSHDHLGLRSRTVYRGHNSTPYIFFHFLFEDVFVPTKV